jgi:hypothetical protein
MSKATAKEKIDLGSCHEITEIHRRSLQLTRVLDQIYTEVAKYIDFAIEDIAQGNIFERAPDNEKYTGYTGNEGVSTTHFYNDTVFLVLPKRFWVDLLYKRVKHNSGSVLTLIKRLQDNLGEVGDTFDASKRLKLERLCELIIEQKRKTCSSRFSWMREDGVSNEMMAAVAIAALKVEDVVLLKEALQLLERPPPLKLFGLIRTAIPKLSFVKLRPALWIAFKKVTQIDSRRSALLRIAGKPSDISGGSLGADCTIVDDWISAQIGSILSPESSPTADDGISLAEMTKDFGPAMLMQGILPYVEARSGSTAFSLAFLFHLFEIRGGRAPTSTFSEAYRRILEIIITQFGKADSERMVSKYNVKINAFQTMQILEHCEILSLDDSVDSVLEKMEDVASTARIEAFGILLFPYLDLLLAHLQKRASDSILTSDCSDHVHMILETYVTRFVRPEPLESRELTHWTPSSLSVRCRCYDCLKLTAFMEDHTREMWKIRLSQARRKHLQDQVPRNGYDCKTIACGMSHFFVVTKVHKNHVQEHRRWRCRFDEARARINGLDSNPWLRQLLGDTHDEIVNLRMVCRPSGTITSDPSRTKNPPAEQVSGNKRERSQNTDEEIADRIKRRRITLSDSTSD